MGYGAAYSRGFMVILFTIVRLEHMHPMSQAEAYSLGRMNDMSAIIQAITCHRARDWLIPGVVCCSTEFKLEVQN